MNGVRSSARPQPVEWIAGGKRARVSLEGVGDRDVSLNDLVEERVVKRRVRGGFTGWPEMLRVGQR